MPFAKLHLKVMPGSPHFVLLLVLSAILSLVRPVLADNAGTIQFASDSYDVFESSGSVTLTVLINRTGDTSAAVSVHFATMAGTASASRFTPVSGTLSFAPGSPVATITVPITNDTIVQPPQSFTVVLSSPINAVLDPAHSTATVTIQDDDGINTVQFDEANYGGVDEGFGTGLQIVNGSVVVRLRATRGADPNLTLTVQLNFEDETALYGGDYIYNNLCARPTPTISFPPGVSTQTVVVSLINPDLGSACGGAPQPGTRTFRLRLTNPGSFTTVGQQGSARVTIFGNNGQPNTVQFVTSAVKIKEGSQASIALHVIRYGAFSLNTSGTTVQFTTELQPGDTAQANVNFTPTSGSLTFTPIISSGDVVAVEHDAFIVVPIPNNTLVQGDVTFHVTLTSADNAQLGDFPTIQVTVVDDDLGNTVQFVSPGYTVAESAGNAVLTIRVTQNGDPSRASTVDYVATPITAFAGFDFSPVSGTLIFAPFETTKTILIPILNDSIPEDSETFRVTLFNPSFGTLIGTQGSAIVTIIDDDAASVLPVFEFNSSDITASNPTGVALIPVTLVRGANTSGTYTVNFATHDISAVAGTDYQMTSGTLTFGPGETAKTISVPLIIQAVGQPTRQFKVTLSNPSLGSQLGDISEVVVSIINPDTATKVLNVSTRGPVEQGNDVMIAGFIIQGSATKQLVLRGIGASLLQSGVPNALANPNLSLYDASGNLLSFNDDYTTNSNSDKAVLTANGLTPTDSHEAAIVTALSPGIYTAILRGTTNGTGLVEVYDVSSSASSSLVNISTRGKVEKTDNGAMIAGFIIQAPSGQAGSATRVVVRASGPSLQSAGISDALADTTLDLYRGSQLILSNDNWKSNSTTDQNELKALGL
ncbi:MAG: Calx-beta domain-containing protein, partial [Chthoniobacterales bacterium]